jgi:hypothetical protein
MTITTNDGLQGLTVFIAVPLGVVPLIMLASGSETGGLWSLVLDEDAGPAEWVCPSLVVLAAVVAIALLERRKRDAA